MADELPNGTEMYMTVREMVKEIRSDVKELKEAAAELQSVRDKVNDQEIRLRAAEKWIYGIPLSGLLAAGAVIAALIRPAL